MFERARLTLTAWYLVIIMTISLLFSFVIYSSITQEFHRFERIQVKIQEDIAEGEIPAFPPRDRLFRIARPDPEIIEESRKRVLFTLAFINLIILGLSGAAGYFLAGRTLRPIKKMVDEQKRFITDASHELRTPLTSLRSEIEVGLRNKKLTISDAQKLLKSNLEEVISLQGLSDNLLELAQNGRLIDPKNFEEVLLEDIIEKAQKKVEPLAKRKHIVFSHTIKRIIVFGIADRITELFIILLDNAVKYSPQNSSVIITAKKKKNKIVISVSDQGAGIAKEDLPYIFDRFYRADKSRSTTSGYGLGLSIAKKIVEAHGGTIGVKNNSKKGTTFLVTLPV